MTSSSASGSVRIASAIRSPPSTFVVCFDSTTVEWICQGVCYACRTCTPKASPTRGSCRRRRLMRWCSWVIGRASTSSVTAAAVSPSPHRGRLLVLKNQKNAPQKGADQQTWPAPSMDGRYSTATSYKSDTPYQAARTKTPVR